MKKYSSFIFLLFAFWGCISSAERSYSPDIKNDLSQIHEQMVKRTASEAVDLWVIETLDGNNNSKSKLLRIDLIKPSAFADFAKDDNNKAKELIRYVKNNLVNPEQYSSFIINEITIKSNTHPSPNVNSSIAFDLNALKGI